MPASSTINGSAQLSQEFCVKVFSLCISEPQPGSLIALQVKYPNLHITDLPSFFGPALT
jgi:hypothetical protein